MRRYEVVILFIVCISSRLLFSIYYTEDIDSLRFALASHDFDVLKNQPHFPGYAVFCYLSEFLLQIVGSMGITFALIGGLSSFMITFYLIKIWRIYFKNSALILIILSLFNPLLWLMSVRYMPDIFGLALLVMACYFFIDSYRNNCKSTLKFFGFTIGVLAGVRLSYLPFFLPLVVAIRSHRYEVLIALIYATIASVIWFIPWLLETGLENMYNLGLYHSNGHFNQWGGGITSEKASFSVRLLSTVESIWADGLGGWWIERHWSTFITSIGLVAALIASIYYCINNIHRKLSAEVRLLGACVLCYTLWAFLFQNIVYKPRHIMPLLPFLIIIFSVGLHYIKEKNKIVGYTIYSICGCTFLFTSAYLLWQHKSPSAISQVKNCLQSEITDSHVIYADGLQNYYFSKHKGLNGNYYLDFSTSIESLENLAQEGIIIMSMRELPQANNLRLVQRQNFYHNPYVNRLWSELTLYTYIRNNE